jgi:small subunit ribosomal protein S6
MREYELIYVVQADLDEAMLNTVIERVDELVKSNNGEAMKTERWGKRKMAYPIRKMNEGFYVFMSYKLDPAFDAEFRRNLKYIEQVMRFIVKRND